MATGLKRQKTFIQRNVPIADSICYRYLPLLGFPQADYVNKDLFVQPNKEAFYKIMHFLYGLLDKKRCSKDFRDCYPIFDKKAEGIFRQVAIAWYNELATVPENGLYTIAPSVFLFPGGGKFMEFINQFVRFVALLHLKRNNAVSQEYSRKLNNGVINLLCKVRDLKSGILESRHLMNRNKIDPMCTKIIALLKMLIIENMKYTRPYFVELNQSYEDGKQVVDRLSLEYRELLEILSQEKEKNIRLKRLIVQQIADHIRKKRTAIDISTTDSLINFSAEPEDNLRNLCNVLGNEANRQLDELCNIMASIEDSLSNVEGITVCAKKTEGSTHKREFLNVSRYFEPYEKAKSSAIEVNGTEENLPSRSFSVLLEKIAAPLNDKNFMLYKQSNMLLPRGKITSTVKLVTSYKKKLWSLQKGIENELQETNESIVTLCENMRNNDWKSGINNSTVGLSHKQDTLWHKLGYPVIPPSPPLEFVQCLGNSEQFCINDDGVNEITGQPVFLMSSFGTKINSLDNPVSIPKEQDQKEDRVVAADNRNTKNKNSFLNANIADSVSLCKLKSDAKIATSNSVMSSTVMHDNRTVSTSILNIHLGDIPLSPISPVAPQKPIVDQFIIDKNDNNYDIRKGLTSGEVYNRMSEYITKLNDTLDITATGLDDEMYID